MSAIGPSDHQEFCQRDEWQDVGGTGHDKWEKRLPDGRLLRTTIQRHKSDYGAQLKSMVLSQLEVDEATFWTVIETGTPADRPAPPQEAVAEPINEWIVHALQQARLNEQEIGSLTVDEAEHLAITYFSMPRELSGEEIRQRLFSELETYRGSAEVTE